MQKPRQVPQMAPQRQQFSRDTLPPVQSALAMPPPQQTPEMAVMEQMQDLALEIYSRLAVAHLSADHYTEPLSHEHLKALANHSQIAAKAYFESLGVKFNG